MAKDTQINQEIFDENEKSSFRMLGSICIIFSVVEFIFLVLNFILEKYDFHIILMVLDKYLIMFTAILNMLCGVVAWIFTKHAKILKYIISFFTIILIGIIDFSFSYIAVACILIPVIVSARFYDKKFTIFTISHTVVTLFFSFLANFLYNNEHPYYHDYYIINFHLDIDDFWGNFACVYLIKVLTLATLFIITYLLVSNGRRIIKKQALISSEISSLETDLKTSSNIQNQVLPKDFEICKPSGIDLYATMKPAKNVGGDFYDFFQVRDQFFFLIGDVSDKGLAAAMFMMNVKNIIHSLAIYLSDLEHIVNETNKLVCKDNKNYMFVTLWIGCLNVKTKKGFYINAGHNPAFLIHKNKSIEKISSEPQKFIGAFPNCTYKKYPLKLKQDEFLFLYTDGITDAINKQNKAFKEEGLLSCLNSPFKRPVDLCESIITKIKKYIEGVEQYDDITMLSIGNFSFDFDHEYSCKLDNIQTIMNVLNSDLRKANVDEDKINLINTALDDMLSNIISYAYKNKNNKFRFQYKIDSSTLIIVTSDKGTPFNPLEAAPPDLGENRPLGGLGIHLIKKIMDTFEYSRNGNENISVLTKDLY